MMYVSESKLVHECIYCINGDVSMINNLNIDHCRVCPEIPTYIPTGQIRKYIRSKYYENNL